MEKTICEKILKEVKATKEMLVSIVDNMYKTQESHHKSLEVFSEMAQCFKSLNEKFDCAFDALGVDKRENKGFVLSEEQIFGGMLHILVGFNKAVSSKDLEKIKKDCSEKYGLPVAFVCQVQDKLVEVFMQESNNINI